MVNMISYNNIIKIIYININHFILFINSNFYFLTLLKRIATTHKIINKNNIMINNIIITIYYT